MYNADVLQTYFKWRSSIPIKRYAEKPIVERTLGLISIELPPMDGLAGQIIDPHHKYFSPGRIGRQNYNKAQAALSRSCKRLEKRGLVRLKREGRIPYVEITAEGRAWDKEHEPTKQAEPKKPKYDWLRQVLTNKSDDQ